MCACLPLVREIRTSELVVVQPKTGYYSSLECSGANKKGLKRDSKGLLFLSWFERGESLKLNCFFEKGPTKGPSRLTFSKNCTQPGTV